MNTHFINDGMAANQPHPSVPTCTAYDTPTTPTTPVDKPSDHVAFYAGSSTEQPVAGAATAQSLGIARILTAFANQGYNGRWTSDVRCSPNANSVNFSTSNITRLAGYSLGRLGPVYALNYLRWHNGGQQAQGINDVLMYDPGNTSDLGPGSCDVLGAAADAGNTLGWWLTQPNTDHRLVIYSGSRTADRNHQAIQDAYFSVIRSNWPAARSRILVCNYSYNHTTLFTKLKDSMISSARPATAPGWNSCPRPDGQAVWGWNP